MTNYRSQKSRMLKQTPNNFTEAIRLNPHYADAFNNKGVILVGI